jgi:hypothetical protein
MFASLLFDIFLQTWSNTLTFFAPTCILALASTFYIVVLLVISSTLSHQPWVVLLACCLYFSGQLNSTLCKLEVNLIHISTFFMVLFALPIDLMAALFVYKTRTYNKIQTLQSLTSNLLIIFFVLWCKFDMVEFVFKCSF